MGFQFIIIGLVCVTGLAVVTYGQGKAMQHGGHTTRQHIAAILLMLLAVYVGLTTLPFLGKGFEGLLAVVNFAPGLPLISGEWAVECFALAFLPGAIAYGLWRRRRWARTITLWTSVLAIPRLLVLRSANALFWPVDLAVTVAVLLGVFAASIVYFLTRPETKALFGIER